MILIRKNLIQRIDFKQFRSKKLHRISNIRDVESEVRKAKNEMVGTTLADRVSNPVRGIVILKHWGALRKRVRDKVM